MRRDETPSRVAAATPGAVGAGSRRLARGALAGAVAWWVMDQTLQAIYDRESPEFRRRESVARDGVPALEVMAERLALSAGRRLRPDERRSGGTVMQWAMGIGSGMLYAAVRERVPGRGLRRGLAYGVALSLVVDETLTPLLGFSPGPAAFPWQTHARGLAGHLVFGAVAETTLTALDRAG